MMPHLSIAGYLRSLVTRLRSTASESPTKSNTAADGLQKLTQKEYLIALRNRLFAVEEEIWLHEYAEAQASAAQSKVEPLSQNQYNKLVRARAELLLEYPVTQLIQDYEDAKSKNLTYAAMYIERLMNNFKRQIPLSLNHVNQIAVLSFSGQVVNLMRGQGAVYHRLLPSTILSEKGIKRQFQHPSFSNNGKHVAFIEMHFKDTGIERSDAIIFEVPNDPKTYGKSDSLPIFDSGSLGGTPFFIRFSPDDENIVMLCTPPPSAPGSTDAQSSSATSLVMLEWSKYYRKDNLAGNVALSKFVSRKVLTLLQGNPLFFTYTTASPHNATIVAHCQKELVDENKKVISSEKAVWALQKQDTSGVSDYVWKKVCASDPKARWSTPACHSAGGGDNVLVVEDGFLTTKALSRWKRDPATGQLRSKKLLPVQGQIQFLVSPDSSRVVVLQEDINIGLYSLTVIEGEAALDPSTDSLGSQYELPSDKLTVAFWFSPDSTKLLCLNAVGKSKNDVSTQKAQFRVGLNSDMQWSVFTFPLQELGHFDVFKPTPYFMKTYVPFFSQYAQVGVLFFAVFCAN